MHRDFWWFKITEQMEQPEIEIKGILVEFFRNGTNGDYLDALNSAIDQLKLIKNLGDIGDVNKRFCDCDARVFDKYYKGDGKCGYCKLPLCQQNGC